MQERDVVLVVGGAGYIGSHVARALAQSGRTPVVLDNFSSGYRHNVRFGPCVQADINDKAAVLAAIDEYRPASAMHFAACIEVGEGERDPARFYKNNVAATLTLLEALRERDIDKFVFSSTCAVYGVPETLPLTEDTPRRPQSVYGRTKRDVEEILESYGRAYGFNAAILRYFNAAGAASDASLGEEHEPETHLIPNALKAAYGEQDKPLTLFGDDYPTPDGTCLRDYIHVEDLAQAHLNALTRLLDGGPSITANIGAGQGASVLEIIEVIAKVTGRQVPYEIAPRRQGDVPELCADTSYARSELGFELKASNIENIITTARDFYLRGSQTTAAV